MDRSTPLWPLTFALPRCHGLSTRLKLLVHHGSCTMRLTLQLVQAACSQYLTML